MLSKKTLIATLVSIVVIITVGISLFFWMINKTVPIVPTKPVELANPVHEVIGKSVQGRDIDSYTYFKSPGLASSTKSIVFVGGMHGGYEWNSVLLAYKFMDYLSADSTSVPSGLKIVVIPDLNPDAVYKVTGKVGRFDISDIATSTTLLASARFNADGVDLNRNFGCKWQPTSMWQNKKVSAGTSAFSEPEALALKNFMEANKPLGVVFWHSQADAVYASECKDGVLPVTLDIMNAYAKAGGYPAVKSFDAYPVTGDSEGWLASIGVPAITVELKTHDTIEWDKNLAGIRAVINYFK